MEQKVLRLREWLRSIGEIAFWLFPMGMVIDAYGEKKTTGRLPHIAYQACMVIEGVKLVIVIAVIGLLLTH